MYDRNPGEIDFGSSLREVRVSKGSSYRESTVLVLSNVKVYSGYMVVRSCKQYINRKLFPHGPYSL